MQEGTISKWLKQPGDTVKKGDVLGEIETDKATMDLEAYEAGVLEQILVPEGETVPIGQAIAIIGSGAGTTTTPAPKQEQPVAQASASTTVQAPPANTISTPTEAPPAGNGATGVKASPLARRMAEEHHLDLSQLRALALVDALSVMILRMRWDSARRPLRLHRQLLLLPLRSLPPLQSLPLLPPVHHRQRMPSW
jgi:pyruvate/2-oxoglutarate dehydrogenase complex dihydrolipoamide acyltransferase (E2) component